MPLLQSTVYRLEPSLDGERLSVTAPPAEAAASDDTVMASLVNALNDTYNTKAKGWGRFAEQGEQAGPLLAWLTAYQADEQTFAQLANAMAERLAQTCRVSSPLAVAWSLPIYNRAIRKRC